MNMPVNPTSQGLTNSSTSNIFSNIDSKVMSNTTLVAQVGISGGSYVPTVPPLPPMLKDGVNNVKSKVRDATTIPQIKELKDIDVKDVFGKQDLTGSLSVVDKVRELNRPSRLTRSPQMTASLYEQLHAHYNNLINQAGVSLNKLGAARAELIATYGMGQVSASEYQLALSRLNGEIGKIRAVMDASSGEVALLSYQNAGSAVRTRIKNLDVNVKSLYANISAQQKQIGMELKTVDQAVAQLKASGSNEIALSNRKLNTSVKKVLNGANDAIKSNMQPGRAVPDKNGIIPVPSLIGDVVLTPAQQAEIGQFYIPLRKLDLKTIDSLNPQVAGKPRINVDQLGSDALLQKNKLAALVKEYGSIQAVAKKFGFQSVKQMENLRSIVKSKSFDPSNLNASFERTRNTRESLAGDVGRISVASLKKLQPIDRMAQLKIIGREISEKVRVPEWFKSYAKEVNLDVDTLVAEAYGQYYLGKAEAGIDLGMSEMSPMQLKEYVKKVFSGGTIATVPNIWPGTQVRLERLAVNLKQLQLVQVNTATSFRALNNAARSYDTATKSVGVNVENAEVALKDTQKQINNVERNYGSAKLGALGEAVNKDALQALKLQYQTALLALRRTEYSQKIAYSLAVDRSKLTQAIGKQASVTDAGTKIVEDMGTWNTRHFSNAVRSGITGIDGGKVYKTDEGLIIEPTVLTKFWKLNKSGPTANELKQASNQTLVDFQAEFSVSGKHIRNRTNQGLAGIGAFNGNLSAYQSRMVIQPTQGPPTAFKIPSAPTVLEIRPDANAKIPPVSANDRSYTNPKFKEAIDGRQGAEPQRAPNPYFPSSGSTVPVEPSTATPEPQAASRDSIDRDMQLAFLTGAGRLELDSFVDDPAKRAKLWSDHGILVKRVGNAGSMIWDVYALPSNILSPARNGSKAVASDATPYKRVYDPMYSPGLIPSRTYTPIR